MELITKGIEMESIGGIAKDLKTCLKHMYCYANDEPEECWKCRRERKEAVEAKRQKEIKLAEHKARKCPKCRARKYVRKNGKRQCASCGLEES